MTAQRAAVRPSSGRLLTPKEVEARLGISHTTLYKLLRPGGGLASLKVRGQRRISEAALEAYIGAQEELEAPDAPPQ